MDNIIEAVHEQKRRDFRDIILGHDLEPLRGIEGYALYGPVLDAISEPFMRLLTRRAVGLVK